MESDSLVTGVGSGTDVGYHGARKKQSQGIRRSAHMEAARMISGSWIGHISIDFSI